IDAARTVAASWAGPRGRLPSRLDPFGRGVLTREGAPGGGGVLDDAESWTPLSPEEITDQRDPLLAFDAGGEPLAALLPPEPVWLIYPQDRVLRADTEPRVQVVSRLPLTWNGWRLVQLDLSGVAWLELEPAAGDTPPAAGDTPPGTPRRRLVSGRSKPRLVTGAPVPGIHTGDGRAILGTLPAVMLPAGEARWRVEVRRPGSGAVLGSVEASGDGWDPERLWGRVPRPVLGELVLTVTALSSAPSPGAAPNAGPGAAPGTGLRRVVVVAEGLEVSYSPALRLTGEQGLEAAEAMLCPASGMTVSPCAAAIGAGVSGAEVACVAGPVVLALRVSPPHCRIRIEPEPGSAGTHSPWHSHGPLLLAAADLTRGGALRLDLPGRAGDPPVDVVTGRGVVQVLEPSKQGRYPLARVADTVRVHGGADLRVTIGARTAVLARISGPEPGADPWVSG
ncbi:MAG: hypothetical protein ACRDNZ_21065, partial [Streptosporangiaceae bacterium]